MSITYQSSSYLATAVAARYVRSTGQPDLFKWVEINERKQSIREGYCFELDLPKEVASKALQTQGTAFSFVEWPIEK